MVSNDPDGIHVRAGSAEFVLQPSGYLRGSMQQDGKTVTLDDPATETGQRLTAGGQDIEDFVFDLKSAKVSEAQEKLGKIGKHIEVSGASKNDHVELTKISGEGENQQGVGSDFASTPGTGGVLGTKFTWPDYGSKLKNVHLNSEKEAHWKKWISLYNEKMLSKGNFLDLYVYGYDFPEGYVIEKNESMYYAFYAPAKAGVQPEKLGRSIGRVRSNCAASRRRRTRSPTT